MEQSSYDQVVREATSKIVSLVLTTRIQLNINGRINKWFNIELEELEGLTEELFPWRQNIHLPLILSIYLVSKRKEQSQTILLERWKIVYDSDSPTDNIEVPTLYKKFLVLARSVLIFVKSTPGYQIFKECKKNKLSTSKLVYKLSSKLDNTSSISEQMGEFKFDNINTPYGRYSLTVFSSSYTFKEFVLYEESLLSSRFIISDYDPRDKETSSSDYSNTITSPRYQSAPIPIGNNNSATSLGTSIGSNNNNSISNKGSSLPRISSQFRLSISPFRESELPTTSTYATSTSNLITMKPNISGIGVYSTTPTDSIILTQQPKYSNLFNDEEPAFSNSNNNSNNNSSGYKYSILDQESEVGYFVSQCQNPPTLSLFEKHNRLLSFSDLLSNLHNVDF